MKKSNFVLLLMVLVFAMLLTACGGGNNTPAANEAPAAQEEAAAAVEEPIQEEAAPAQATIETDFPLLADAQNVMDTNGTIIYQSGTSLQDAYDFYYGEFSAQGLTEDEILTLNEDGMFQLVFTGSENGKSIVVQTIKLDDSTINVSVRYE